MNLEALSPQPPDFSEDEARQIVSSHYGLTAEVKLLMAERDQNFKLTDGSGTHFVLKISNAAEDSAVTDFQTQMLTHIQDRDPSMPVPRVVHALNGQVITAVSGRNGEWHQVRVLSWLDGLPLREVEVGRALAVRLGTMLARLDLSLADYKHPASDHDFNWDMKRLSRLHGYTSYIDDSKLRAHVLSLLDKFDQEVEPRLSQLRTQAIYNDLNPGNVLINCSDRESVSGIIDFGDAVDAPLIIDLAVACAYQVEASDDPFRQVGPMVQAYHRVLPLADNEIELLFDLIRMRHVMTILITHWRAALHAENLAYIMRNCPLAIAALNKLALLDAGETVEQFRRFAS